MELNCFSSLTLPSLQVLDVPLTVKIRTGVQEKMNVAHKIIPKIREWGASMVTVLGYLQWCWGLKWLAAVQGALLACQPSVTLTPCPELSSSFKHLWLSVCYLLVFAPKKRDKL